MRGDFDALAEIGAEPGGGISRLALSPADVQARAWLGNRILDAGLLLHDDDAANLSGVLRAADEDAKTLLIGSHLDTVPNGGRYDGAVGIVAALECVRTIRDRGIELPVHLEAINFTDDEGCWASLFGARALAGMLQPEDIDDGKRDNATFRAALNGIGFDARYVLTARREPDTLAGYLELHIEHGTRLERAKLPIGVVTGIVGRKTYKITYYGQAGHSGTTDMYRRRDALRGAAAFIVRAHELIRARYGDGIFNCGNVEVKPGTFNIIPSEAICTVEVRHVDETLMHEMETAVIAVARESAAAHDLEFATQLVTHMPAAAMDTGAMHAVETACSRLNVGNMPLVSYAGHAAQMLAHVTPSAMIFIPSKDGIGHSPKEFSAWDDIVMGANVLLHTILEYAER